MTICYCIAMKITTKQGLTYERRAWTGGDKPDVNFGKDPTEKDLIAAYYNDQVVDCGGLDLWECAGTTAMERVEIFMNRAIFDAWRTLRP
jgi:hypothetical protein